MTNPLFYWILLTLCGAYVFIRGGVPERIGIAILVMGSILSTASATANYALRFRQMEAGIFLVDVVGLIALVALALRANRFWPLWVAGFHLVGVATHAAMAASPDVVPRAYAMAQAFWGYPMLAAMVAGTWRHRRRLARFGADEPWSGKPAARKEASDLGSSRGGESG